MVDYEQISMTDAQTTLADCATGNGNAILANRISHSFDLHGTSQTIDTGCSGSLVAVHQAVQDLRSGNSDMVCLSVAPPAPTYPSVAKYIADLSRQLPEVSGSS